MLEIPLVDNIYKIIDKIIEACSFLAVLLEVFCFLDINWGDGKINPK